MRVKSGTSSIVVSVLCFTFNHEKYIRDCLDGFLNQKTDFEFEIIIHDDASTDETIAILREYKKKYPEKIKIITEQNNQFSLGKTQFFADAFKNSKGQYIAFCEGDDYWTSPHKLQKQYDLMKANPSYALCFHPVDIKYEGESVPSTVYPDKKLWKDMTRESLLSRNFIPANSVLYRRIDYRRLVTDILPIDWYIHLYHAVEGDIGFIAEVMAVYRRHDQGVWWESHKNIQNFWNKNWKNYMELYLKIIDLYGSDHTKIINQTMYETYRHIVDSVGEEESILEELIRSFPEFAMIIMKKQNDEMAEKQKLIFNLREKLTHEKAVSAHRLKDYSELLLQHNMLLASKSWKITKPLRILNKATRSGSADE